MLDDDCIEALQYQLEQIAFWLVANPTDNSPAPSNLTAGSLPRVCSDIHQAFTSDGAVQMPARDWLVHKCRVMMKNTRVLLLLGTVRSSFPFLKSFS